MHQEHTIPWNNVASNLNFARNNPGYTPRKTGLFPRNLSSQAQDLNHFKRILAKTIITFAETERAKYAASLDIPSTGLLFSDEMRERYPEYMKERENQRIERWVAAAIPRCGGGYIYDTRHGGLADVVKILIAENEMPTLLMLARHPQIPLLTLRNLTWGHWFGFSRVAESALQVYLLVNLIVAMGLLEGGEYLELPEYAMMVKDLTDPMDYPAQQLPHQIFLNAFPKDMTTSLPQIHRDLPRLREYLKTVFRLLYRYDVVLRECGIDPEWDEEIGRCFAWAAGRKVKLDRIFMELGGRWVTRFI